MNEDKKILDDLNNAVQLDDFIEIAYELTDKMMISENPFVFVEPILKLMENNYDIDFGQPGPLVHFVEKFYKCGYEKLLLESVGRSPTTHTIWMINRILKDPNLEDREIFINALKNIRKRSGLNSDILNEIDILLKR